MNSRMPAKGLLYSTETTEPKLEGEDKHYACTTVLMSNLVNDLNKKELFGEEKNSSLHLFW